ncbi:hypothetical protein D3C75_928290 [compost metagenome]
MIPDIHEKYGFLARFSLLAGNFSGNGTHRLKMAMYVIRMKYSQFLRYGLHEL